MPMKSLLTPEEIKERERERHRKWYYNKYHSDEEFRQKIIKQHREYERAKKERLTKEI